MDSNTKAPAATTASAKAAAPVPRTASIVDVDAAAPSLPLPLGLETLRYPTASSYWLAILNIFGDALRPVGSDTCDVERICAKAAVALNMLCPAIDESLPSHDHIIADEPDGRSVGDEDHENAFGDSGDNDHEYSVGDYVWEVWTVYLDAVRAIPGETSYADKKMAIEIYVGILDALRQLPRGVVRLWYREHRLWNDLPLFDEFMAESENGPWLADEPSDDAIRQFCNQSALRAQFSNIDMAPWENYGMDPLRDALEGGETKGEEMENMAESNDSKDSKDSNDSNDSSSKKGDIWTQRRKCDILTATTWLIYGSPKLLQLAQLSDSHTEHDGSSRFTDDDDDDDDDDVSPGPLFRAEHPDARHGMSGVRWSFWKVKLEALLLPHKVSTLPNDVRDAVACALAKMEQAEHERAEHDAALTRKFELQMEIELQEEKEKKMTKATDIFELEKLRRFTSTSTELAILAIFRQALRSDVVSDVEKTSALAAAAINALCPPIGDTRNSHAASEVIETFLWELWTLYLEVARSVPHNTEHPGQATLIGILDALRLLPRGTVTIWNGEMELWSALPLLRAVVFDHSSGPWGGSPGVDEDNDVDDEAQREDDVRYWRNQNAFLARCLQEKLATWDAYAVRAMEKALEGREEEENERGEMGETRETGETGKAGETGETGEVGHGDKTPKTLTTRQRCDLLAATTWAIHSSPALLDAADMYDVSPALGSGSGEDKTALDPGPRFRARVPDARAGLTTARWAFWKTEFQALLHSPKVIVTDDVREAVALAVERMELAEAEKAEKEDDNFREWEAEMELAGDDGGSDDYGDDSD
ncbi:hypothetical protein HMPREF1624_02938 [Sporothrix schenckii ATCC 58251]|uniref:Nuclear pore complex protein n=1 Tax=Sporothrix schenckii (strain ATCC 58251 / de Perez 2211183) TaxID=1391915 RepID=U7Q3T7_SPOS1|nr:hypothetical protein HMPREF1624_02938 [Sporothrix schenckii ATCC 58251]